MGRLHYVEVKDFKSYKGVHKIGPFKRFTAIIGPNGAGKSNLMDAISFVLGERTQSLRVRSLKELIHGAPIGRPVSSRASVTAIYLSDDGIETRFTRSILGSSSEYRVNDKLVTGSEYSERLAELGILIKAKNFLVFQGDVEAIAMKNPRELTHMFEEISRSIEMKDEYDSRKKEMDMSHEDANGRFNKKKLLTKEKKEVREMKEEAEKYQKTQKELADKEILEKLFKMYHAEEDIKRAEGELRERQEELNDLTRRRETCEEQLKLKRQELARLSRESAVVEKKMRTKEADLSKLRPEFINAKQKSAHVMKRLQASKSAHAKALKKHEDHEGTVRDLERDYQEMKETAERFEEDFMRKSGQAVELQDAQLQEYYRLKGKVNMKAAKINQELQEINRKQNKDKENKQGMEMKKNEIQMREQELLARKTDIDSKVERHEEDITAFKQDLEDKKKQFDSLRDDVQSAHYKYHDITNALERLKDKLDAASMDQRELEKQRQNRELLENLKRLFPGVYGRLLDLCEPVHQRYQLALTRVLGHNMESIVVDSEHTGRDCIQYLKDQRIEPHTFLPLDGIRVYSISEKLRSLGGTCKLLFDCVKYSTPEVKKAVQFACGDTVVCDTMEEAQTVAYGKRERHKTVSLDGTLFRKSGEITGGMSELKKKAKRWDDKEVEKLVRQRDKCLEDLRKVTQARSREAELRPLESDIKILEMKLRHVQKSKDYEQTRNMVGIQHELEGIVREKERMDTTIESLTSAIENREGKIKRLEAKISAVEDEVFVAFCDEVGLDNIRQYEEQNVHAHQERMKRKNDIQNQLIRLQNQLEYERSRDTMKGIRTLSATIKKDEEDLKRLQSEEEQTAQRIDLKQEEVDALKESLQERRKGAEEKEFEVKEVKNLLNTCTRDQMLVQKKITIREGQIEQQRHERHQILKACKMEGVELPLLDGTLDSVEEGEEDSQMDSQDEAGTSTMMEVDSISTQGARRHYAQEMRIKIDYSELPDSLKRFKEQDAIRKKTEEIHRECINLRASLEKYVGADLKASDRLKDVEDRLRAASDDMDTARKEFNKKKRAFDVVAKTRRDRFQESFDHVADVIDDTYKKLSNNPGAIAQIHLEDSCEPFNGGINYHIIPPGKRYRTMDQLSGGERTIAALALLFSIHSYQPSPFFVLDEVDASLDNINIAKLANYIKHHTKHSFQCIVISLKEEFYYHSDALVGVYGQPGGDIQISGIATLDLSKYHSVATPLRSLDNTRDSTLNSTKVSSVSRDTTRDRTLESSLNDTPVKTGPRKRAAK